MAKKTKKTNKNTKLAIFFWLIFAAIIVIAFFIARNRIQEVLDETDFFNEMLGDKKETIIDIVQTQKPETVIEIIPSDSEQKNTIDIKKIASEETKVETITPLISKPTDQKEENLSLSQSEKKESPKQETKLAQTATTDILLCFVAIDSDGTVVRKELTRTVEKTSTPLTASLKALLAGPSLSEMEKGTMSLIPEGTKLLSASITDKVAYLSFSDEFNINKYGVEGYIGQLMQIVYTATAFSTIDSVQFLVNGQKQNYLGGEGVWIGTPLPRSSFK